MTGWPTSTSSEVSWQGNLLTDNALLAGGLWLAGTYAYLYSDLVVRRVGTYTYLAALCFLLAEVTIVGLNLEGEWLIAILAVTALAANLVQAFLTGRNERVTRTVPPLAITLSALPVLLGLAMHLRATSQLIPDAWKLATSWPFVAAMVLVAACNRASAWLCRGTAPRSSAAYFFGSAAAAILALAGLLRALAPIAGHGVAATLVRAGPDPHARAPCLPCGLAAVARSQPRTPAGLGGSDGHGRRSSSASWWPPSKSVSWGRS